MSKLLVAALILGSSNPASAVATAPADHSAMDHSAMASNAAAADPVVQIIAPKEPGQSAYAALSETVRILFADPQTNWSKVDVDTLRGHLVDMDNVTLRSRVVTTRLPNGARFTVSGNGDTIGSIQRMTKSHFAMKDAKNGWMADVQDVADGVVVAVTADNRADSEKIAGLGFFGIMALGEHHQPHHLMMAQGAMRR